MSVRFELGRPDPTRRGPSQMLSLAAHGLAAAVAIAAPALAPVALPEPRPPRLRPIPSPDLPRTVIAVARPPRPTPATPASRPAEVPAPPAGRPDRVGRGPEPVASTLDLATWAGRMLGEADPAADGLIPEGGGAGVPGGMPGGAWASGSAGPGQDGPLPVGGDVERPVRLAGAPPRYPELARSVRLEGEVVIGCTIDASGAVRDARVVSGPRLFHEAALEAVSRWRYAPTRLNGVPVAVRLNVVVRFTLR